jgi:Ca2+/H+ antiporter, TMEM165/GDT1 family
MDSLLATFLSLILAEMGDRPQLLAAVLALRYRNDRAVVIAVALASLINSFISAVLGSAIHNWISGDPLRLFNGLAYVLAGIGMLAWRRKTDLLENWTIGPFWTAFLGIFILQFGDKGQFIIGANAAFAGNWIFPAIGGWLGCIAAIIPAIVFKERLAQMLPINAIRIGGGVLLLLFGIWQALQAWRLV